jgi:anti-sigma28 factor (negative regulator of flagellin synthesis)
MMVNRSDNMVNRIESNPAREPQSQPVTPQAKPRPERAEGAPQRTEGAARVEADELELSAEAMARLRAQRDASQAAASTPDTSVDNGESPERLAKIEALRKQVEDGTYKVSDEALADKLMKLKRSEQ